MPFCQKSCCKNGPHYAKICSWASVQSDQGLHCPLTESLDTTKMYEWRAKARCYLVHPQNDLNLCILRMFEGIFPLDVVLIIMTIT